MNDLDFDVGLHVVFTDRAAHDAYQTTPAHLRFIAENKDNWKRMRVFDSVVSSKSTDVNRSGRPDHDLHHRLPRSLSEKPMSQGTEHHLEEAEHAQHAKHDPFDRRVALSMAIVAAALASVTLLSHRSHAEVQVKKTEESDQWNFYQAKKNRSYMYAANAEMLEALSRDAPDSEAGKKAAAQDEQVDGSREEV